MFWLQIPKAGRTISQYQALNIALSSPDVTVWRNDENTVEGKLNAIPKLKAAIYEENRNAFFVEDRGRFWHVILK